MSDTNTTGEVDESPVRRLRQILEEHSHAVASIDLQRVERLARRVADTVKRGRRVWVCGCGGSAADAQHFAAEMVGRFVRDGRTRPLPVIALTTDSSVLTAIANDFHFDRVFERQLLAHCQVGDLLIAISTSGRSPAVTGALEVARGNGVASTLLTGQDPGACWADHVINVGSPIVARVQEAHELILHMVCERVEHLLQDW